MRQKTLDRMFYATMGTTIFLHAATALTLGATSLKCAWDKNMDSKLCVTVNDALDDFTSRPFILF